MLQTFNVPAGGRQVDAKASFFRIESVQALGADESVRVRADGNDLGTYLPGDSIRLPLAATRWEVNPVTLTATAVVRLGIGQVDSARLLGVVQVIDTNKAKTIAGAAFSQSAARAAAGVGQYSRCGVWNPAASGRRFVIEKAFYSTTGASSTFYLGLRNSAAGLGAFAVNKLSGGAASAYGQLTQDNTAILADVGSMLLQLPGTSGVVEFKTPVVLMPGYAFVVAHSTANQDVYLTTEFVEELLS